LPFSPIFSESVDGFVLLLPQPAIAAVAIAIAANIASRPAFIWELLPSGTNGGSLLTIT
jgi:hypothetical protein